MKICIKSVVVLAAMAMAGCVSVKKPAYDTLISHRGESKDAPENTMAAFKTAVERGFGFECDVYLSKDKKLFTFHDKTLSRTTAGANTNRCTEANWEGEISKLNVGGWGKWKGSKFDPSAPALLEDVLELARDGRYIYVEVKDNDPTWVPYIKEVFAKSKKAHPGNVLFITFGSDLAAELKRQMPEYKTYWLTGCRKYIEGEKDRTKWPAHTAEELIEILNRLKVDGIDIQFDPAVIDEKFVRTIKAAGYSLHVWTIDELDIAQKAFAVGADTLTTNRALGLLKEFEDPSSLSQK